MIKITNNYVRRAIKKEAIEPMLSYDPEIQAEQAARVEE